ncbi:carbohydrate ABC transporter permease [Streptomyces mexicanus]|uniref:Sugar ABC transporter permease n=1 Tax=Streptomyces mexicanus TaxID=178566 RepID=A0A7X1LP04_9ACTN|nr:sugar ABC transporter permease [Streptomyces mexicanus]MBC2864368.1 sugar ABC transporter permease [Streptomyces mexicanus]
MANTALTRPARQVTARPAQRSRPRRRGQRAAYVFLSPWIIGATVLTVGPMLASLYLSFTDYDLFDSPKWVGLDNYVRMFTEDDRYWHAVTATLEYVVVSVPLKLALALAVAMLLNKDRRGTGFYRSAFYAPSLLGASVSVALVWRAMYGDGGVAGRVLGVFGIDVGSMVDQPRYALLTVIALAVWQFGAPMVIFLAGLKQVPKELYEAAALDGAGPVRRFLAVTLPMLSPVLLFNLVLETIHAFQSFTSAFIISSGRGGPSDSTLLYTLYLYQRGFNDFRMGYASAMAWVLLVVVGLITVLLFRGANRWVFYMGEGKR